MSDNKELNILVLSMSTFPREELKASKYFGLYKNKKVSSNYVGQLEAGTKFLIRVLKEENKRFDKIVILNTSKTVEMEAESENRPFSKFLNNKEEGVSSYSPDSFFKKRIGNYVNAHIKEYASVGYSHNTDDLFMSIMLEKQLEEGGYAPDDMAAYNICEQIMALAHEDQKINIYLNMQGGIRTTMFIIKAALDLLRERNVEIKEQVAINFNIEEKLHEVKFVADEYLIMDLVAGMRAFINYGRADELIRYLNKREDIKDNSQEQKLVNIIRDIAESIQISDPVGFESALNKLKEDSTLLDKANYQDVYFKIAVDDIKSAYEPLLAEGATTIDTIKWFCDRGFIAQSLTFIEDKMPEYYINKGVVEVKSTKNDEDFLKALGAPSYDSRVPNAILNTLSIKLKNSVFRDYMQKVMQVCIGHYVNNNITRIRPVKKLTSSNAVKNMFVAHVDDFAFTPLMEMIDIRRFMKSCYVTRDAKYFTEEEIDEFIEIIANVSAEEEYSTAQKIIKKYKECMAAVDNEKYKDFMRAILRFGVRDYVSCNDPIKGFKDCMVNERKKLVPDDGLKLKKGQLDGEVEIYSQYILECFKTLNFDENFKENIKDMFFGDINKIADPAEYGYEIWRSLLEGFIKDNEGMQIDINGILEDKFLTDEHKQRSINDELKLNYNNMSDSDFLAMFMKFSYNNDILQKNKTKQVMDISYCNTDFYYEHCGEKIAKLYRDNNKYLAVESDYVYKTMAGVRTENNVALGYVASIKVNHGIQKMKLEQLLRLHAALKQERNNTNHASAKCMRLPLAVIKRAIYTYINLVKEISEALEN